MPEAFQGPRVYPSEWYDRRDHFKQQGHLWNWHAEADKLLEGFRWQQFGDMWDQLGEKFKAWGFKEDDCEKHLIMLRLGEDDTVSEAVTGEDT